MSARSIGELHRVARVVRGTGVELSAMTKWTPPLRGPQQLAPAKLEPLPLTCTARDISAPGAPIIATKEGCEYIARLAAVGATDTAIAGCLRVDRQTFREMRKRQKEVDEALAQGRASLGTELVHHHLIAARNGEWQAASVLGRYRLGWNGDAASSQRSDDLPDADALPDIDWSKVPLDELHFLSLATQRIDEHAGKQGNQPGNRLLTPRQVKLLEVHIAVHRENNGKEIGAAVLEVLRMQPPPTVEELLHVRALRMTPIERRKEMARITGDMSELPDDDLEEIIKAGVEAEREAELPDDSLALAAGDVEEVDE